MDCSECGAPLPPKSNICTYCGALNDTDLRAAYRNVKKGPQSRLLCPQCDLRLTTMDLGLAGGFFIERCDRCLGLFFDPGELEALIDRSVSHVFSIDHQRLGALLEEEAPRPPAEVRYVRCPVCRELMNRTSYGARAGVVADVCRDHGVWLDGGELGQLLKWAKAGGQLYDQQREDERARREQAGPKAAPWAQAGDVGPEPAVFPPYSRGIQVVAWLLESLLGWLWEDRR